MEFLQMFGWNKFHSKKTEVDGIIFDSKREAQRWQELKLMQAAGEIHHLTRQVPYTLLPAKGRQRAVKYIADFVYWDKNGVYHCEDVKGYKTDVYILKRKMMNSLLDIQVEEV